MMRGPATARRAAVIVATLILLAASVPISAFTRFPGRNGRILFVGRAEHETRIFSMRPDGTAIREIGSGSSPALSPDGTIIAFTAHDPSASRYLQIFTMGPDGGDPLRITRIRGVDAQMPAWSPAGDRIVFCADHVYTVEPNGEHLLQVTHGATDGCEPAWSPDGTRIALDVGSRIITVDVEGHDPRPVTPEGLTAYDPSWSPDGNRIAFVSADIDTSPTIYSLCTIRLDGSGLRVLAQTSHYDESISGPSWSPDGRWIAFVVTRHFYEANDTQSQSIFKIRPDGTYRQHLIGGRFAHNEQPDWGVA